jgi:hypothetical protein
VKKKVYKIKWQDSEGNIRVTVNEENYIPFEQVEECQPIPTILDIQTIEIEEEDR